MVYDQLFARFDVREFSSEHELLIARLQPADSVPRMLYPDPSLPEVLCRTGHDCGR